METHTEGEERKRVERLRVCVSVRDREEGDRESGRDREV